MRLEDERLAALVVIGARPDGTKEVVALEDGYHGVRVERDDGQVTVLAKKRLSVNKEKRGKAAA